MLDSSHSIDTDLKQKPLDCHLNFQKCTLTVEYRGFTSCNWSLVKTKWRVGQRSSQMHNFKLIIYAQTALIWKLYYKVSNAMSNFAKYDYICCLCAESKARNAKPPLSCHNMLKYGTWVHLKTAVAWYSALPLILRYHCLGPTNRDISRVHCTRKMSFRYWNSLLELSNEMIVIHIYNILQWLFGNILTPYMIYTRMAFYKIVVMSYSTHCSNHSLALSHWYINI